MNDKILAIGAKYCQSGQGKIHRIEAQCQNQHIVDKDNQNIIKQHVHKQYLNISQSQTISKPQLIAHSKCQQTSTINKRQQQHQQRSTNIDKHKDKIDYQVDWLNGQRCCQQQQLWRTVWRSRKQAEVILRTVNIWNDYSDGIDRITGIDICQGKINKKINQLVNKVNTVSMNNVNSYQKISINTTNTFQPININISQNNDNVHPTKQQLSQHLSKQPITTNIINPSNNLTLSSTYPTRQLQQPISNTDAMINPRLSKPSKQLNMTQIDRQITRLYKNILKIQQAKQHLQIPFTPFHYKPHPNPNPKSNNPYSKY